MRKKSYWKELCLLFIGIFIGVGIEKYFTPPSRPIEKVIDVKRDTIVKRDTLYVHQTIVPLNKENVLAELKRQQIPHANIVLAQSRLETGNYTSKVCKNKNNLFGIRKGNKYKSYNSWKESISDYKRLISSRYKNGDYYQFLERIKYAEDKMYIQSLKEIV
jgi:uncharacterized FlgJ-related protein